jgi:hypothetical protein
MLQPHLQAKISKLAKTGAALTAWGRNSASTTRPSQSMRVRDRARARRKKVEPVKTPCLGASECTEPHERVFARLFAVWARFDVDAWWRGGLNVAVELWLSELLQGQYLLTWVRLNRFAELAKFPPYLEQSAVLVA